MGCNKGFDYNVDKNLKNELWEPYETEPWFYDLFMDYYRKGDKFRCYEKGRECDSKSDGEINIFLKKLEVHE